MERQPRKKVRVERSPGRQGLLVCPLIIDDDDYDEEAQIMNPVILDGLFRYCSKNDMGNCRLVCTRWYRASIQAWLTRGAPLKLVIPNVESGGPTTPYSTGDHLRRDISEFQEEFHVLGTIGVLSAIHQYRKFDVKAEGYDGKQMKGFWLAWGMRMTFLNLQLSDTLPGLNAKLVGDILALKQFPNLERLALSVYLYRKLNLKPFKPFQTPHENLKSFVLTGTLYMPQESYVLFFNRYHNLEEIVLKDYVKIRPELTKIFAAIKMVRQDRDNSKLQNLKTLSWFNKDTIWLENPISTMTYGDLQEAGLELESFGISFSTDETESAAHRVLRMYSNSLKKLKVCRDTPIRNDLFAPPGFAQLEYLTVARSAFESLLFLKHLPNLRFLTLESWGRGKESSLICESNLEDLQGLEFPSITHLACVGNDYTLGDEELRQLCELMPNITNLQVRLSKGDDTLPIVSENLAKLEHLSIGAYRVGDRGILGLIRGFNGMFALASIANLQHLRTVKLFLVNGCGITRRSVLEGFLTLPLLEKLEIRVNVEMSPEIKEFIQERIPFAAITMKQSAVINQ